MFWTKKQCNQFWESYIQTKYKLNRKKRIFQRLTLTSFMEWWASIFCNVCLMVSNPVISIELQFKIWKKRSLKYYLTEQKNQLMNLPWCLTKGLNKFHCHPWKSVLLENSTKENLIIMWNNLDIYNTFWLKI